MKLDYPQDVQRAFHLSYPVADDGVEIEELAEEPEVEVTGDEPAGDVWEREQNKMVRKHLFPRKALFSPLPQRQTFLEFEDGNTRL